MSTVTLNLEDEIAAALQQTNQPLEKAARELIVLELYRRGSISGGKAAQLLGLSRRDFIRHASGLGIPYLEMSEKEWDAERSRSDRL